MIKNFIEQKSNYLLGCIICFGMGYFLITKSTEVNRDQLRTVEVTLKENPKYTSGKFSNYLFVTNEYYRNFKVTNFELDALDKQAVSKEIRKGDKLTFWVTEEDAKDLNRKTAFNNYNSVYGIQKNDKKYLSLDQRDIYNKEDNVYSLVGFILGIVSLIYLFFDDKISIKYYTAMYVIGVLSFIILLILNRYNLIIPQ